MTNGVANDPLQKYHALDQVLGEGASSTVYLGQDVTTSKPVALKLMDCSNLTESSVKQLEGEVKILKKVSTLPNHEDYLELYDVIQQDKEVCLATEYIEGGDLGEYCGQYASGVPERIGKWTFQRLLKATAGLHDNNICHRDLKLENIMYNKQTHKVKLIDFGFATETVEKDLEGKTQKKLLRDQCGSVHYVAPEILKQKAYDGTKADVWSLGIILFVLLSGMFPFDDSQSRSEIIFDQIICGNFFMPSYLSSEVQPLLKSMLHADPNKRPSVSEILKHPWFSPHKRVIR